MVDLWKEIVSASLVGTSRKKSGWTDVPESLRRLLDEAASLPPEQGLLKTAAVVSLWQRAGDTAVPWPQPVPEPAAVDDLPRCSAAAAAHLGMMLDGHHKEILPEWLELSANAGQRGPEEHLPALLDLGQLAPVLRPLLAPVLGKRGQWLAGQNPNWDYSISADDDSIWDCGRRAARLAFLERRRGSFPDQAREMVERTWKDDGPEDRAAFVSAFALGLGMADEPFLENALDDRRKEVRQVAAQLLAAIPQSRFSLRMLERTRPLLTLAPPARKGSKSLLSVTLPAACDKAMERDGVAGKARAGTGEKASWLVQMLGCIPPATWNELWRQSPEQILEAATETDYYENLLQAWSDAAVRHGDVGWAEALLSALLKEEAAPNLQELIAVLTPEKREAFLTPIIAENKRALADQGSLLVLLQQCRHRWSIEFSRVVLDALRRVLRKTALEWQSRPLVKNLAVWMNPALTKEAGEGWPKEVKHWETSAQTITEFLVLLQFRHEVHRAFGEKNLNQG